MVPKQRSMPATTASKLTMVHDSRTSPLRRSSRTSSQGEQESEYEGGNEAETNDQTGDGAGDLTPGQDSTGSLQDENSPPLVGSDDPDEGEVEQGPVSFHA